jgi:hypothetical protein
MWPNRSRNVWVVHPTHLSKLVNDRHAELKALRGSRQSPSRSTGTVMGFMRMARLKTATGLVRIGLRLGGRGALPQDLWCPGTCISESSL